MSGLRAAYYPTTGTGVPATTEFQGESQLVTERVSLSVADTVPQRLEQDTGVITFTQGSRFVYARGMVDQMSWRGYCWRVWGRTYADAREQLKEHLLPEVAVMVASWSSPLFLLPAWVFPHPPGDDPATIIGGIIVGFAALGAFVTIAFGWALVWAPVNLARGDAERISKLESMTSGELDVSTGFPIFFELKESYAKSIDLADVHFVVVVPGVSIVNQSQRPLEIEIDLGISFGTGTKAIATLQEAEDAELPVVQRSLHRDAIRGGQLLPPFRLEPTRRARGYVVFLIDRGLTASANLKDLEEEMHYLKLSISDGLTNTLILEKKVHLTWDEFIETLECDREGSPPQ